MYNSVFGGSTINQAKPTLLQLNPLSANVSLSWPVIAAPSANVVADLIEATPSAPGFIIMMPDARVGSTGVATIFNNLSNANSFIVQDNLGNTILTAAFGTTWLLYLADNSTQQGTWHAFQYGSNAGSINLAAIAGAGLVAQAGSLSQNLPVTTQSTNYVSVAGDRAKMFVWTGGAGTFTMPTAAVAGSGWYLQIKNSGGGDLTVSPPAGTIDGSASKIFHSATVDSATVFTDGTNYFTMGFGAGSAASSFGYITVAVGGNTDVTLAGGQLNQISYKLTGVLTGNINLIVPASVQQYWINNATTGAFTITVKTGAGTGLQVGQGTSAILYCDGTNVVAGQTGAAFPILVSQGGTGAASAGAALTNLGGTGVGTGVFTASTTNLALIALGIANAAGNWTIAAPSSGTTLIIGGFAGAVTASVRPGNSASPGLQVLDPGVNATEIRLNTTNTAVQIQATGIATVPMNFLMGSTTFMSMATTGAITINAPSSGAFLTLADAPASVQAIIAMGGTNGRGSGVQFLGSSAAQGKNWFVGNQFNASNTFEITPSTANGGSTFTSPAVTILGAGNVTINAPSSGTTLILSSVAAGNGLIVNQSGGGAALTIAATGAATIAAPTATNAALTVNGSAATPGINIGNSGTSIVQDITRSNVYRVLMTGNVTTFTLQNPQDSQTVNIFLTQDGTGTRTIGGAAGWTGMKWAGGIAAVLSTAINTVDLLVATYRSDTAVWYATLTKAFS